MPAETTATRTGVIHDLGYQRYDGPRFGRAQIVRALAWHSFRAAFGLGRGAKAKIIPVIALVALCLPAVVNAFAMSRGNPRLVSYDAYQPVLRDLVMTVFVAVQAPEMVSRDLRSRVLPLYFSRPMKTIDYPVARPRRALSEARNSPIAASDTAHRTPSSRPGISARGCAQTAEPPCTFATDPPYSRSSGTSSTTRRAAVNPRYLASG